MCGPSGVEGGKTVLSSAQQCSMLYSYQDLYQVRETFIPEIQTWALVTTFKNQLRQLIPSLVVMFAAPTTCGVKKFANFLSPVKTSLFKNLLQPKTRNPIQGQN